MPKRLFIASTALTAAVAISAIAVSMTGTHTAAHPIAAAARISTSMDVGHRAPGATKVAGLSPLQGVHADHVVAPDANLAGPGVGLGALGSVNGGPSASTPTLLTIGGTGHVLAGGAQRATPVAIREDQAIQGIFKGGMWLPNANGGREYATYDHHLVHDNGDWTWVGKVQTDHGPESAVITFGKDAVFGRIPQASGDPLRIVTTDGQKLLVQTDGAKMAASAQSRQLYARQDFVVPQHAAVGSQARMNATSSRAVASSSQPIPSAAAASGGINIDVMVAYTSGYASAHGGSSATLTRINNLVDIANQAYVDSGVHQYIRLVHAMQVSYSDTNDNTTALDDLTGNDGNGNSLPVPSSLKGVASARSQYGADLVVLLRKYNNAGNGGCGVGWLIGGDEQQIIPSEDNAFGYSVVQDGSDGGYYCLDTTFAHELGHNMGSAHDRANADKDSNGNPVPGAYSYSFGYLGNGSKGFATIMAYGSDAQTPVNYFSNPNVSECQNTPCGVADSASNSADNAHSLNNTAPLISQFEPITVPLPYAGDVNDINGDGKTDLLWKSQSSTFAYWLMDGAAVKGSQVFGTSGYQLSATGDFNGDGILDLVWTNGSSVYMWLGNGSGYTSQLIGHYGSGWVLVGAGDMNGDGRPDLLWHSRNSSAFTYWTTNGTQVAGGPVFPIGSSYRFAGSGDFNGDSKLDVLWTDGSAIYAWLGNGGHQFTAKLVGYYGSGWVLKGVGDIDGDGAPDLLFHNQSGASFAYWLLRNCTVVGAATFPVGSQFTIGAIGDFNGDGKSDLMWTDGAALYEWIGSGHNFAAHYVANYGGGWSLIQMGESQ